MVVSRRKPSSKNATKFRGSKENYTAESSQAPSVNSASRALGYDKIDGKRKARGRQIGRTGQVIDSQGHQKLMEKLKVTGVLN